MCPLLSISFTNEFLVEQTSIYLIPPQGPSRWPQNLTPRPISEFPAPQGIKTLGVNMRAKPLGWDVPHQPPVGPLAGTWHCFLRAQGFAFNLKYREQQHFYKPQAANEGLTPPQPPKKEVEMEMQEDKRAFRRGQFERKRNRGKKRNLLPHKPQRVESICEPKGQKEGGTS